MEYPSQPMHSLLSVEKAMDLLLKKDEPLNDLPTIPEFYAEKEIFITGGSGFMGKVLIEKLLRSCPDIKKIYILIRTLKGKSIEERLSTITELPLFDVLRRINPDFSEKLVAISGDVSEINLGMNNIDINRMKNVSIIFHTAASVRFDDSLKYAVMMNTRGTREVMQFAEGLKDIKVVMHVSTTYSNPHRHEIEEEIYPPAADWKKTIEVCERIDDNEIDYLTSHYSSFMPNTYTFTKNLAESIVDDFKSKIPLVIFRPSIVVSAVNEPLPGWVDNFNGPMGLLLGSGLGITRTMNCDPNNIADFIPVDVSIKAMIIAAWKRAHEPSDVLPVYNCSSSKLVTVTLKQLLDIGISLSPELPFNKMIWKPDGGVTLCSYLNYIRLILFQVIPAVFIDAGLQLRGEKPLIMRLQRKIFEANEALKYFVTNNWNFKNQQFVNLNSHLRIEDYKEFDFKFIFNYDIILYMRNALMGYRRFLLKEKDEDLPKARSHFQRVRFLDRMFRLIPYVVIFYILATKTNLITIIINYLKG